MKRREFIALLGGAAAWPVVARGQQPSMPVVGFLHSAMPGPYAKYVTAFLQGLKETGYVDGQNVAIEYRWAENQYDRVPAFAADLVRRQVALITTPGDDGQTALAAKAATTTIPIVFSTGGDPVQIGLVASLNRPGGNITGFSGINSDLGAKQLGLLRELIPKATRFAVLVNPNSPLAEATVKSIQAAGLAIGRQIEALYAGTYGEIEIAFEALVKSRADSLIVSPNPLFGNHRAELLTLAARHGVPVIYPTREWAERGGLMSYGSSLTEQFREAGVYTGRILKGAKPADLPILRPTKFELVINLKTAKTLGLTVPNALLAAADEVIE